MNTSIVGVVTTQRDEATLAMSRRSCHRFSCRSYLRSSLCPEWSSPAAGRLGSRSGGGIDEVAELEARADAAHPSQHSHGQQQTAAPAGRKRRRPVEMLWPAAVKLALDQVEEALFDLVRASAMAPLAKSQPRSCRLSSEVSQYRKPVAHAQGEEL